VSKGIVNIPL